MLFLYFLNDLACRQNSASQPYDMSALFPSPGTSAVRETKVKSRDCSALLFSSNPIISAKCAVDLATRLHGALLGKQKCLLLKQVHQGKISAASPHRRKSTHVGM